MLTKGLEKVQDYWMNRCERISCNSGVNRFWILKNSNNLLDSIGDCRNLSYKDISTWDFSTLYTTIPHSDLKKRIRSLIHKTFEKNDFHNLVITSTKAYFGEARENQLSFDYSTFVELFEFLIDNIYIQFGDRIFRQIIGIPMGTNCAPLLANLYLFSYEYDFLQSLTKRNIHHGKNFNLTFRYIDDLLSVNNKYFKAYLHEIYPNELELKETTGSNETCSYLDLALYSDGGKLKFRLYDKRDDFDFDIVNYPFLDSNIPSIPAYGVYVSRLVNFARVCSDFGDFAYRHQSLVTKLVSHGYRRDRLKATFLKFCRNYAELLTKYNVDFAHHINTVLTHG